MTNKEIREIHAAPGVFQETTENLESGKNKILAPETKETRISAYELQRLICAFNLNQYNDTVKYHRRDAFLIDGSKACAYFSLPIARNLTSDNRRKVMTTRKKLKTPNPTGALEEIVDTKNHRVDVSAAYFTGDDTLGGRIQMARVARGLTVAQFARRIGVVSKTVRNWETDCSEPRTNKLQILAGVLSVPMLWLLGGEDGDFNLDFGVNVEETASLESKAERLLKLHEQSAMLIYELQSEIRRLQREIDDASIQIVRPTEIDVKD